MGAWPQRRVWATISIQPTPVLLLKFLLPHPRIRFHRKSELSNFRTSIHGWLWDVSAFREGVRIPRRISSAAYLFAPYLLMTLYVRHALADFTAFAFMPFSFWGLYCFIKEKYFLYFLFGTLSISILILSSISVALITFPALVFFLIWIAYSEPSLRILFWGIWCRVLGLGLSAFFWMPALFEREYVQISRRFKIRRYTINIISKSGTFPSSLKVKNWQTQSLPLLEFWHNWASSRLSLLHAWCNRVQRR